MTRSTRFRDSFWDLDIVSSQGYDVLSRRMKEGKKFYQDVEHFLHQRAKIENDYSKDLKKLSENSKFKSEFGTLDVSWKDMKLEMDKIAQIHETIANDFDRLASELAALNEEQRKQVKSEEESIHRSHSALKNAYGKYLSQEKTYYQKCEEWEKANYAVKYYDTAVLSISQKEREKNKIKEIKCKEDMERNEKLYKFLVEEVQKAKSCFETDMMDMCDDFQELDEKRIDHLREALWKITNIDSKACVNHDECCERVRLSLEKCAIEKDITDYIANYRTGTKKPPSIFFKDYFQRSRNRLESPDHSYQPSSVTSSSSVYDEIGHFGCKSSVSYSNYLVFFSLSQVQC